VLFPGNRNASAFFREVKFLTSLFITSDVGLFPGGVVSGSAPQSNDIGNRQGLAGRGLGIWIPRGEEQCGGWRPKMAKVGSAKVLGLYPGRPAGADLRDYMPTASQKRLLN